MIKNLTSLYEFFKSLFEVAGPAIIVFFALALIAGLVRWTYKTRENIKDVTKNPILIVLWIILSIIGIYYFYKYLGRFI